MKIRNASLRVWQLFRFFRLLLGQQHFFLHAPSDWRLSYRPTSGREKVERRNINLNDFLSLRTADMNRMKLTKTIHFSFATRGREETCRAPGLSRIGRLRKTCIRQKEIQTTGTSHLIDCQAKGEEDMETLKLNSSPFHCPHPLPASAIPSCPRPLVLPLRLRFLTFFLRRDAGENWVCSRRRMWRDLPRGIAPARHNVSGKFAEPK